MAARSGSDPDSMMTFITRSPASSRTAVSMSAATLASPASHSR